VDGHKIRLSKDSSGDSGLVCNDKNPDPEFVRLSDCPGGIGDEVKFFRTGEEIQLGIQSAVAVEEKSNLVNLHALIA
jgi:hypothetical protein